MAQTDFGALSYSQRAIGRTSTAATRTDTPGFATLMSRLHLRPMASLGFSGLAISQSANGA
jgi:hypothetical protein